MNKDKTIKMVGTIVTLVGVGISLIQKQLDKKNLEDIVQKEVQKQLKQQ